MSKRRTDPETWRKYIVTVVRGRAVKRGIEFSITPNDIDIPSVCPVLLIPFVFGGGRHNPHGPTIDRIDPKKGYVPGNIAIISHKANRMKTDCVDPEAFRRLANWLEALQGYNL